MLQHHVTATYINFLGVSLRAVESFKVYSHRERKRKQIVYNFKFIFPKSAVSLLKIHWLYITQNLTKSYISYLQIQKSFFSRVIELRSNNLEKILYKYSLKLFELLKENYLIVYLLHCQRNSVLTALALLSAVRESVPKRVSSGIRHGSTFIAENISLLVRYIGATIIYKYYNNFAFVKTLIWMCIRMRVSAMHRRDIAGDTRILIMFINSIINSIIRPRLIPSIAVLFALAIQQIPIMIVPSNRNCCRNQETWFAEFITKLWSGRLVLIIKLNAVAHERNTYIYIYIYTYIHIHIYTYTSGTHTYIYIYVLRKQFNVIIGVHEYFRRTSSPCLFFTRELLWRL